jgi:Family of unknown function (DUF6428)
MNQTIPNVRDQVAELPGKGLNRQDQLGASKAITIKEFLNTLRAVKSDQKIVFQLDKERLVAAGYHVTEVKAVIYNTMDCGGVADKWDETVVQLWNPSDEPERDDMKVGKFLAIERIVDPRRAPRAGSDLQSERSQESRGAN